MLPRMKRRQVGGSEPRLDQRRKPQVFDGFSHRVARTFLLCSACFCFSGFAGKTEREAALGSVCERERPFHLLWETTEEMRRTTSTSRLGSDSGHASDARSLHSRRSGHTHHPHDQQAAMAGLRTVLETEMSAGIAAMDIHSGSSGQDSEKSPVARASLGRVVATETVLKASRVARADASHPRALPPSPADNFLETCFLCRRLLRPGTDIFMYRGDQAFCSIECRSHQIEADERKEKYRIASVKKGTGASLSNPTGDAPKVSSQGTAAAL